MPSVHKVSFESGCLLACLSSKHLLELEDADNAIIEILVASILGKELSVV
jgi:hypothetical protein